MKGCQFTSKKSAAAMRWLRQHQRNFGESIAHSVDPTVGRRKDFSGGSYFLSFLPFWLAPDEYGYGGTHRSGAQPSILGSPAELVLELVQALTRNPNTISPRSSYSVKASSSSSGIVVTFVCAQRRLCWVNKRS